MLKKIFIVILLILTVLAAVIFIYRYQIMQYSAETIIRKSLPDYVRIDKIDFKPQESKLILSGFKILNPPGFSDTYLLEFGEIVGSYRMMGKSIIDGIEVLEPIFKNGRINIERLANGDLNLIKMQAQLEKNAAKPKESSSESPDKNARRGMVGNKKISQIVKLPETFLLKNGKIVFIDRLNQPAPHVITFENMDSTVTLKLDDLYSRVLSLASTGTGRLNGRNDEIVKWNVSLNPTTPRLTMSNRFEVSNLSILPFEPYYDKYSPLVFKNGYFSGLLIFDFDNGNIGSSDELHLSGIRFYVKPGYENAQFWQTTVPDLVKYFTSPYGDIVFDFKIKGDMSNPQFYLGPISKQALVSMAIDKISTAIEKSQSGSGGPKSDIDKAKDYIDLFKGLINKK